MQHIPACSWSGCWDAPQSFVSQTYCTVQASKEDVRLDCKTLVVVGLWDYLLRPDEL